MSLFANYFLFVIPTVDSREKPSRVRVAKPRDARAAGARDSCSATFPPRIFEQKRDCSQSSSNLNSAIQILRNEIKGVSKTTHAYK